MLILKLKSEILVQILTLNTFIMLSPSNLLDKLTKHYSMSDGPVINIDRNVKPFFSVIEIHFVQKKFQIKIDFKIILTSLWMIHEKFEIFLLYQAW